MKLLPFDKAWRLWYHWRTRVLEWASVGLLALLIIGPLTMLGWLAFFTDTFVVQAITIVDARDHTTAKVRDFTSEQQGKNILSLQTLVIEQRLLAAIPQLRDVHIVRKLPGTLKIILQEKTPALLLLSSGKYYFVDFEGIAYEEASLDTLPGIVLPVVKSSGEAAVEIGTPAVAEGFVQFVREAQEKLPSLANAEVVETRIPSLAAREVHFLFTNNWVIKFDTTRPLASQLDVFTRLLQHTIPEEERGRINYIDLRIPNRVYYKLN